jgi:hypothetical protein
MDGLKALNYGAKKPLLDNDSINTFKRTHKQWERCSLRVRAATVARQQPVRQWTAWVAIMWESQQNRMHQ